MSGNVQPCASEAPKWLEWSSSPSSVLTQSPPQKPQLPWEGSRYRIRTSISFRSQGQRRHMFPWVTFSEVSKLLCHEAIRASLCSGPHREAGPVASCQQPAPTCQPCESVQFTHNKDLSYLVPQPILHTYKRLWARPKQPRWPATNSFPTELMWDNKFVLLRV